MFKIKKKESKDYSLFSLSLLELFWYFPLLLSPSLAFFSPLDSLTFLSFALSTLVCPPFPPSFLSESVPDYSGQLQFKMTKWRSSSCHKIKWNEMAHGKSRRMLVCSPVCVCARSNVCMTQCTVLICSAVLLTVYDICPVQCICIRVSEWIALRCSQS